MSFVLVTLFYPSGVYGAQGGKPEFMSLEEVEARINASPNKEIKAHFLSVPRGTQLKRYDIVLRGVFREPGRKVITFVTSDKIVAGMSGSPVYLDNKLIGALAYSLNSHSRDNYNWGGISPISLMMEEANAAGSGRRLSNAARSFSYNGMFFKPIATGYEEILGTQLVVTKSSVAQARSYAANSAKTPLRAGMPIVVDLFEWTDENGEITTMSALGTITYVGDDGRIFAFGHPFLNTKKVIYNFRTAEIMGTAFSEDDSFKLTGDRSEVLGVIVTDSTYGIYGALGSDYLNGLHSFNLEFKMQGEPFHSFEIRTANSILTPTLARIAFEMIGHSYGAPLPQEKSVTQIEARVGINNHNPVVWKELFVPTSFRFGPDIIFISSYSAANEAFFGNIYGYLSISNYDFEITNVDVAVNFIPGQSRVFELGAYKFPNKVVWGEDPLLEILLVSQDNTVEPLAKRLRVTIDWDKVEKPIYSKATVETDKVSEKMVQGVLTINSSTWFYRMVSSFGGSEKQKFMPDYFLKPEDFLENFSNQLEATNQKLFARVALRARSGLFDKIIAETENLIPESLKENGSPDWHIVAEGLKERKSTIKNEGAVYFYIDLPPVPNGYVVDQNLNESFTFEVVAR